MKVKDITASPDVEYAVAVHTEARGLGESGLTRCTVLETGVERPVYTGFSMKLSSRPTDGVHVREVRVNRDGEHREHVVRPQAVKGTWAEHEQAQQARAERDERVRAAKVSATQRFDAAVAGLREHVDLRDYENVDRFGRRVRLDIEQVEALVAALTGERV